MRRLISSGSPFEAAAGYSRAVIDGEWVFVAGTTGFDYAQMTIAEDPAEQARQAFRNIEKALAEAGASLADVVRVRYYLPDLADWPAMVPVLGEVFGAILYAAEKATAMALDAIQILGGNGYINDYPTGRLLRDAKLYEIGAGTSEIRRMLIGREIFQETA